MTQPVTLYGVLEQQAQTCPDATAYVFLESGGEQRRRSFTQLLARVQAIAGVLQRTLARGERALLMYQPGLEFIEAMLACFASGVVAVPVPPLQNRRMLPRLSAVAKDSGSNVLLTARATEQAARSLVSTQPLSLPALRWIQTDVIAMEHAVDFRKPSLSCDEFAFLQYTSGSTGDPKGVMVSHGNLLHNEAAIQTAFGHDKSTVFVGWLPLYHDMGLVGNVFQPLYVGIPSVLFAPMTFLTSPVTWLKAISEWRATTSGGPSFAYELCVQRVNEADMRGVDLSSWKIAFNGAEPVKAHVIDAFIRKFGRFGFRPEAFYPCYGMAETTLFLTGGRPTAPVVRLAVDAEQLGANRAVPRASSPTVLIGCGHPRGDHHVQVVSPETGEPLPDGQVGEIWTAGPSVAQGYWGKPELTQAVFQARTSNGRGPYLRTGDLGFLRQGELYITGRLKDLVIVRGQNHYPSDIESTVYQSHEALRENGAAAFTIENDGDARLTVVAEIRRAVIAKLDEALRRTITSTVRKVVSDVHGLRLHDLVLIKPATLPTTSSGKIRRNYCRELYLKGELDRVETRENEEAAGAVAA